jgi:hypothetical protein
MAVTKPPLWGTGHPSHSRDQECAAYKFSALYRLNKNDREHLRATLFEFSLQCCPCHAVGAVLIEGCHAVFKFRALRIGQGKLIVFETVPKLRNKR